MWDALDGRRCAVAVRRVGRRVEPCGSGRLVLRARRWVSRSRCRRGAASRGVRQVAEPGSAPRAALTGTSTASDRLPRNGRAGHIPAKGNASRSSAPPRPTALRIRRHRTRFLYGAIRIRIGQHRFVVIARAAAGRSVGRARRCRPIRQGSTSRRGRGAVMSADRTRSRASLGGWPRPARMAARGADGRTGVQGTGRDRADGRTDPRDTTIGRPHGTRRGKANPRTGWSWGERVARPAVT